MKYIFFIISTIILSQFSACQNTPKLCINCKFYTKDFLSLSEFGKCSLFPREIDNDSFLVNGVANNNIEYIYCSTARKFYHMCGTEGKFYQKK
jgi:hypothetical protein